MKIINCVLFLALLPAAYAQAGGLQPLNEVEMGAVTGQNAIQLSVRLHNNVKVKNDQHEALDDPDTYSCTPDDGGYSPCRLGMEFKGREGHWLVMKQFYGYLNLTDIRLEGVVMDTTPGSYTNEEGQTVPTFDPARFTREDGSCMIGVDDGGGVKALMGLARSK